MAFSGITTALITPFFQGQLDKESFLRLLQFQVESGISSFVLASTTGENPVLDDKEVESLCSWFKDFEKEHNLSLKLLLASGSASTKKTIDKTKRASDLGANAVLVVTPYYNKPPQKGLLQHFEKVAEQSSLPLILYNVPSRTACSLEVDSITTLSQIDNIIGIKEATGDMEFLKKIKQSCHKDFILLSGDDPSCAEFFNLGGHGAISAGANVLAKELIELFETEASNRMEKFKKYEAFVQELFRETNPIGPKQVLSEKGIISSPELRLPLVDIKNSKLSSSLSNLELHVSVRLKKMD